MVERRVSSGKEDVGSTAVSPPSRGNAVALREREEGEAMQDGVAGGCARRRMGVWEGGWRRYEVLSGWISVEGDEDVMGRGEGGRKADEGDGDDDNDLCIVGRDECEEDDEDRGSWEVVEVKLSV